MRSFEVESADLSSLEQRYGDLSLLEERDQPQRIELLQGVVKALALNMLERCPPGRERAKALESLEESYIWAVRSIGLEQR